MKKQTHTAWWAALEEEYTTSYHSTAQTVERTRAKAFCTRLCDRGLWCQWLCLMVLTQCFAGTCALDCFRCASMPELQP